VTFPAMGDLANDAYQQLRLMVPEDEALGFPFANYLAAMLGPGELIESWVRDTDNGPGWGIITDLERAPEIALPWLAQCKGVVLPPSLLSSQWRDYIRQARGMRRGSLASLVDAAKTHLLGPDASKVVRVLNRAGPTAWDITVITRTAQMPETDLPLVNLFTNPSFETNATGWATTVTTRIAAGGTLTRVTAQHHSGVAAGQVVTTAVANEGLDYATLPAVSGQALTVAVWLKGNAGGEALQLVLGDGTVGSATAAATLTTSWQRFSVTLTPTATGTTGFAVRQIAAAVKTWFVDDALAIARAVAPDYGDGSTAGWLWDGTANASTSHRVPTTIVLADILAAKRIGIRITLITSDSPLINEGARTINATTATIDSATLPDVT
jgi:hypothetical protein